MKRIKPLLLTPFILTAMAVTSCGGGSSSSTDTASTAPIITSDNTPVPSSLDASFGTGGKTVSLAAGAVDEYGNAITIDSSGRIVITGYITTSPRNMPIWRFNDDGSIDNSFDGDGLLVYDNALGNDSGRSIAIDAAGNIVVAGTVSNGTDSDMAVWRYQDTGVLDSGFATGGVFTHHNAAGGNGSDDGAGLLIDGSGIYVGGGSLTSISSITDLVVWKLTDSGVLDTTFGVDYDSDSTPDGYFIDHTTVSNQNSGIAVVKDSSARLVLANALTSSLQVVRYSDDSGTRDTSFNSPSGITTGLEVFDSKSIRIINNMVRDSQDNIYVVGTVKDTVTYKRHMMVWRITPAGVLDDSFGGDYDADGTPDGFRYFPYLDGYESWGYDIAIDSQDRAVISGERWNGDINTPSTLMVWRLTDAGNFDSEFGEDYTGDDVLDGYIRVGNGSGSAVAIDSYGRIVVAGLTADESWDFDLAVWRFIP